MATIEELLAQLDLAKFAPAFTAQDIDLATAKNLTEDDLKELGLTIGARKKLTDALKGSVAGPEAPRLAASATPVKPSAAGGGAVQQATSSAKINPCSFKWLNGAKQWPNGAPAKFERMRVADGPSPSMGVLSCRDEFNYVSIVNLTNGGQFALKTSRARLARSDYSVDTLLAKRVSARRLARKNERLQTHVRLEDAPCT